MADTPAGKIFDFFLITTILFSVAIVVMESIEHIHLKYYNFFLVAEWVVTTLFTIEYILRIYSVKKPMSYLFSFYGIVDLLAILPSYLTLIFSGSEYLMLIRSLRLLRVFRIMKLNRYVRESNYLMRALQASRIKITLFISAAFTVLLIIGTAMYLIEGHVNPGFANIPGSIYWAIVTVTTVGYGDVVPVTHSGKFLASLLMILGYAIIAVPTGIVTSEMITYTEKGSYKKKCHGCGYNEHDNDAMYCKRCGTAL